MANRRAAPAKRRGSGEQPARDTVVTIKIKLRFAPPVQVRTDTLISKIGDAIFEYDDRNLLLPGQRRPPGDDRLIGSEIGVETIEQEMSRPLEHYEPPPSSQSASATAVLEQLRDLGCALDQAIDEMYRAQSELDDVYAKLLLAEAHELLSVEKSARGSVKRVRARKVISAIIGALDPDD